VGTATGAGNPNQEEPGTHEDHPEGLLPVPDYSGDWKTRPYLTGTWRGKRQELADKGFTFDVEWLQVGQGIVSGGRDEGWAYATNLDYYINLDLTRMGVLPGALISFRGQFSLTLTTLALYQRSLRRFENSSCKPVPRGLPSSFGQLRTPFT
jgi:hypothetical protein